MDISKMNIGEIDINKMDGDIMDGSTSMDSFSCVVEAKYYDIKPQMEEKRVRVFTTQLMDKIVYDITPKNFMGKIILFFKYGDNLIRKYPSSESLIRSAYIEFWSRTQQALKRISAQCKKADEGKGKNGSEGKRKNDNEENCDIVNECDIIKEV